MILKIDLDVVFAQFGDLFAEVGIFIEKLLPLNEITRMQHAIVVEVKHTEHEISFLYRWSFEERDVELLNQVIHVDSSIFLTL